MCFANYASRFHAKKVSMTIDMFKEQKLQEYFLLKEETEGHLKNASVSKVPFNDNNRYLMTKMCIHV